MDKVIGIVGGVGPYAGISMMGMLLCETDANADQQHLPVIHISMPKEIDDRTAFINGESIINPAFGIARVIDKLEQAGAEIVGIACNTAYSPQIFDVVLDEMHRKKSTVKIVHMVEEVAQFIIANYPHVKNVGILATNGVYKSNAFSRILGEWGLNVLMPEIEFQEELVHRAIYDPEFGIKACACPVSPLAVELLMRSIYHLQARGAEIIVLGCTELHLAIKERKICDIDIIDSSIILARALIRESNPAKLKRYMNAEDAFVHR